MAVGVDNTLLHHERGVGNRHDLCEYFEFFLHIGGVIEIAVDVGYDEAEAHGVELAVHELHEIAHFGKVGKLEVDRVVEVPEHVDIVETYLNGYVMIKFKLRFRNFHYYQ